MERQLDKPESGHIRACHAKPPRRTATLSLPNSTLGSGIARRRHLDPVTPGGTDRPGQAGRDSKIEIAGRDGSEFAFHPSIPPLTCRAGQLGLGSSARRARSGDAGPGIPPRDPGPQIRPTDPGPRIPAQIARPREDSAQALSAENPRPENPAQGGRPEGPVRRARPRQLGPEGSVRRAQFGHVGQAWSMCEAHRALPPDGRRFFHRLGNTWRSPVWQKGPWFRG